MVRTRNLSDLLAYDISEQHGNDPANPWSYSSEEGFLVQDGKIRIYGFNVQPTTARITPRVARRTPVTLTLTPGTYRWCACGHSQQQPFCDRADREITDCTDRCSYKFRVLKTTDVALCRCKRTQNPPFCDCQHEKLP